MFRINDGKPSVSRRKSSTPQKRIIDALTMVDKVEGKHVVTTNSASAPIMEKHLSAPHGASTSTNITERRALEGKKLEVPETNATHNVSPPKKVQFREESLSFPTSYKTVIDPSFYGRGAQQKQLDIHALYADNSQTEKVIAVDSSFRGLLPCPPPASPRRKKPADILPPSIPSMTIKLGVLREGQDINKGKKMVDVHELYGPSQEHSLKQLKKVVEDQELYDREQEFQKSVAPIRPPDAKRKSVQTPPTTSTEKTCVNIPQADISCPTSRVAEMELAKKTKSELPEPEFVDVKELKYNNSNVHSLDRCNNMDPIAMKNAVPSTSASNVKKRVRKLDSNSGQPAPKKRAVSSSFKKRGDVDTIYRARKVYESDCTSNAASDTGTLPQGNVANPKTNICPYKDCSQSFARPWRLAAHIRKHKGERPFRCEVEGCSRDYTNPSHLRRHVLRNHSAPQEKLKQVYTVRDVELRSGVAQATFLVFPVHILVRHILNNHMYNLFKWPNSLSSCKGLDICNSCIDM